MPPRTSAKTRGGDASASRARKPAMKRGGKSGGGGGRKGGPARGAPGLAKAKIPKGKAAAHHQQSFYDVDDEEEDFAGRAAAMDDEFGDVKGQYDDLPSDFEDEEIDEDEAFTEEDKRRYGDIAFESFGKKKGGKRAKDDRFDDDDEFDFGEEDEDEEDEDEEDEEGDGEEDGVMLDSDEDGDDEEDDEEDAEDDADSLLASDEEAERARRDVDDDDDDDDDEEEDEEDEEDGEDDEDASDSDSDASDPDSDSDAAHAALLKDVVGARASAAGDKKRRLKRGLTEAYAESEYGVAPRVGTSGDDDGALPGGAGGLSVSTLMAAAMDGDALGGDALGGARRRLDRLANKKAKPDAAPLPKIVSERVDRKAAYEATGEAVTKWQPIVKQNREKPTLTFVDQERAKMPRKKSIAALNADFVPENDFEREIMAKLRETNATTGRDVERAEDLALNELTAEEVKERRARLAKMRNLLFRHELKAKRVKAIKSKTFHRHNRKTGALKILDGDGNEVDAGEDDDALAGLDGADGAEARREYLRAQERMLLKHKNTSRWAKRAIRKGLAHLPGTKEAIAEQLRIGQELRRKIGIGGERRGGDGDDDDDDGYGTEASSDDDDDDGEGDDRRRLAKAKAATLRAIQDGEKGAEEEGGLFALPFMARALKKKREEAEAEAKALLEEIERADRRAGGGGDGGDDGDDAGEGRWGAGAESFEPAADDDALAAPANATRRSFGGKPTAATRASKRKAAANAAKAADEDAEGENRGGEDAGGGLGDFGLDDDDDGIDDASNRRADAPSRNDGVIKARGGNRAAARAAAAGAAGASEVGAAPANVAASVPRELPRGAGAAKARQAARQAGRAAAVAAADAKTKTKTTTMSHPGGGVDMRAEVDDDDDDGDGNRNASNALDASDVSDQRALLARAFAGDDVAAAFDAEKAAEVEAELPKTEVPKQMPGWGGWAEDQARRPTPKWQIDAERKAKRARDAAAKSRADANLKRVVISEKFDKKAAGFNVEHLPHGFDSKDVYEGSMRAPLGSDVNTDRAFRDLTRPKVLKNAGAVIRPMAFPKGKKGAAKK